MQIVEVIAAPNGTNMRAGDGTAVEGEQSLLLEPETDCEIILFYLA